ncbi:MAG: TonB-dependent receptor [bacterium]
MIQFAGFACLERKKLFTERNLIFLLLAFFFSLHPSWAGTTGIVRGHIRDVSGKPVDGVSLTLSTETRAFRAVSDAKGFYSFVGVPVDRYLLKAERVGWRSQEITSLDVSQDSAVSFDLSMAEAPVDLGTIEIKAPREHLSNDRTQTIYVIPEEFTRKLPQVPGFNNQVQGAALWMPGVTLDQGGGIHLRGKASASVGYFLDGVCITKTTNHEPGMSLATGGLKRIDLYNGGMGADKGRYPGGINMVVQRGGKKTGGYAEIACGTPLRCQDGYLEVGGQTKNNLNWYLSTSNWNSDQVYPSNNGPLARGFYSTVADRSGLANLNFPLGKKSDGQILVATGAEHRVFNTMVPGQSLPYGGTQATPLWWPGSGAPGVVTNYDTDDLRYSFFKMKWSLSPNPSAQWNLILHRLFSEDTTNRPSLMTLWGSSQGAWNMDQTEQTGLSCEYTCQRSEKNLIKAGANYFYSKNLGRRYASQVAAFSQVWPMYTASDVDTATSGVYASTQYQFNPRLMGEAGLRWDGQKYLKSQHSDYDLSALSPSLGLTYTPNARNTFRTSWTTSYQFPGIYATEQVFLYNPVYWTTQQVAGGPQAGSRYSNAEPVGMRSQNFEVGIEHLLSQWTSLKLTAFWLNTENQIWFPTAGTGVAGSNTLWRYYTTTNEGKSRINGLEVYLHTSCPSDLFSGWLSLTFQNAQSYYPAEYYRPGLPNAGMQIPGTGTWGSAVEGKQNLGQVNWDQALTMSAAATFRLPHKWELTPLISCGSGYSYGAGPALVSSETQGKNAFRARPNFVFSLAVAKDLSDDVRLTASVWNVLNNQQELHYAWYTTEWLAPNVAKPDAGYYYPDAFNQPRTVNFSLGFKF